MYIPKINKGTRKDYIKLTEKQLSYVFKITGLSSCDRTICLFTPNSTEWIEYGLQLHLTGKKQLRIVYEGVSWQKLNKDLMSIIFDYKYRYSWNALKGTHGKRFWKQVNKIEVDKIWRLLRKEKGPDVSKMVRAQSKKAAS